jgi:serine/threonine protein phosphatase 1
VPLDRQDSYDLMWIRDAFLWSDDDFGKVVVHGHSVVAVPDLRPNRIAIDTGAYRTGHLTCLVLEGSDRRFLST